MNKIYFASPRNYYGFLSNFSNHPITVNNLWYATTEHFYQASKIIDKSIHEEIRKSKTAFDSKINTYKFKDRWIPFWDDIKYQIMFYAIGEKISQNPEIRDKLLETGDSILIENRKSDFYWGIGDGNGLNKLGEIWMKYRKIMK